MFSTLPLIFILTKSGNAIYGVILSLYNRETLYPDWTLKVEPQESVFFLVKGRIDDVEGMPLLGVTVTIEGQYHGQYIAFPDLVRMKIKGNVENNFSHH